MYNFGTPDAEIQPVNLHRPHRWVFPGELNRDRATGYLNTVVPSGFLFTLMGAIYTVYSEIMNVRVQGTWGYTELIPLAEIGAMPFLQWLLIPPILLWYASGTTQTTPTPR